MSPKRRGGHRMVVKLGPETYALLMEIVEHDGGSPEEWASEMLARLIWEDVDNIRDGKEVRETRPENANVPASHRDVRA